MNDHTESAEMVTQPLSHHKLFQNLTGQKFGRLTVISYAGRDNNRQSKWNCLCDCGTNKTILGPLLKRGAVVSCGCYHDTKAITHGMSYTPEYHSWSRMVQRCHNPKHDGFVNYGGRGITVCDRWRHSFENFFADMGRKPTTKHSIERLRNNENYCPENCAWEITKVQNRNKRTSIMVEYEGKSINLGELAERTGINYYTLYDRFQRGWTNDQLVRGKR